MKTFTEINAASDAIVDAIWTAYADGVDEDGDAVITDRDTLDDVIEILDILARMDTRLMAGIKRENESIL
jgi:hypothetical protein